MKSVNSTKVFAMKISTSISTKMSITEIPEIQVGIFQKTQINTLFMGYGKRWCIECLATIIVTEQSYIISCLKTSLWQKEYPVIE